MCSGRWRRRGCPRLPFGEAARGLWLADRFRELGLLDVQVDEVGNVFGIRPGYGTRYVALSAHIDTVFPAATPLHIRQQGSRLYGPGVADNGAGIAAMLAVASVLASARISHGLPFLFIGNVGEEGEGDLRGMRHVFATPRWRDAIAYSVIVDGAGTDTVVAEALGSRRFEVIARGPGGHSWSDFGAPNPIIALSRAIEAIQSNAGSYLAQDHVQYRSDSRWNFREFDSGIRQYESRPALHLDGRN